MSRELAHLRSEIRHIASAASRSKERVIQEKEHAETSFRAEKRKQKVTEEKLREIANTAEQIKAISGRKLSAANHRNAGLERKLTAANERIYVLERELLGKTHNLDNLTVLQETLITVKAESQRHRANYELEKEKRILYEQQALNLNPERDLEAQFRLRTNEIEQLLREKRAECDNLDWRLKDRSEKLASVSLKMNAGEKENIRFQKRIDKLTETNTEMKMLIADKDQDLEKALDALNILKGEVKSKTEQLQKKSIHFTAIEGELGQSRIKLGDIQNEQRVKDDAKSDIERRLIATMQDHAIAQMTISDLEGKLEKRVKMFDGLRSKVEMETKNEIALKEQHLTDELTTYRAKHDELETTMSAQRQAIMQLKSNEKLLKDEIELLTSQSHTINADSVKKTEECSALVKQLAHMEKKLTESSKRLREIEVGKKTQKKISENLARKYDDERNNVERIQGPVK